MARTAKGFSRSSPAVERASAADRAFLAMDRGYVPDQFGVILLLDQNSGFDLAHVRRVIAERLPGVPRLRQRLIRTPFGCGGPIWIDDSQFNISSHVRAVTCRDPGHESALLELALSVIETPLPRATPLWAAVLITGLADRREALVFVVHHVLADGVGGLAALASLVDGRPSPDSACFPAPVPSATTLASDALLSRLRALRNVPHSWHLLRTSMSAGGGLRPPRAEACSLNQRTGRRRSLAVVHADLAVLRAAAHSHRATVNDAVLVAAAGALRRVLLARGESLDTIVIAVPVSGRERGNEHALGNMVSPMLVPVPAAGGMADRLEQVAAQVRASKAAATGPAPIAVLGWLFRPLAALGGYHWYMNHQHRLHTLVSHVRGPAEQLMFGGSTVISAIPASVGEAGNVAIYFNVLSYAGTLTITVITDPGQFPGLGTLTDALRAELDLISHLPAD
jgi:diacylglycerol O-acyltransferase